MLVILASPRDVAARALANRWTARDAMLLTPADLSTAGWCFDPAAPGGGSAVIAGQRTRVQDIRGVVTCLPAVLPGDLPHIVPSDRAYVAEEMTAFLLAWLSALACPVVNRPVSPFLAGPNWRPLQWAHAAVRVGIRLPSHAASASGIQTVVAVAGRCLGVVNQPIERSIVELAAKAETTLLAVHLRAAEGGTVFAGADPWPDPSQPEVADALLSYFVGPGRW